MTTFTKDEYEIIYKLDPGYFIPWEVCKGKMEGDFLWHFLYLSKLRNIEMYNYFVEKECDYSALLRCSFFELIKESKAFTIDAEHAQEFLDFDPEIFNGMNVEIK